MLTQTSEGMIRAVSAFRKAANMHMCIPWNKDHGRLISSCSHQGFEGWDCSPPSPGLPHEDTLVGESHRAHRSTGHLEDPVDRRGKPNVRPNERTAGGCHVQPVMPQARRPLATHTFGRL